MLCPIHAGPLFHQGLHTKNGLDLLLAHGPVGLVRPYLLFLSSSPTIKLRPESNKNLLAKVQHEFANTIKFGSGLLKPKQNILSIDTQT